MVWDLMPWRRNTFQVRRERFPSSISRRGAPPIDEPFDDVFDWKIPLTPKYKREFVPSIEVSESENELRIQCELPGINEQDIDVSLSGNTISIRGEKKMEPESGKRDLYRSERCYGSFCRSVQLPTGLDLKNVRADFKNGLLSVVLPKTSEHARTVPITPPRMHWE